MFAALAVVLTAAVLIWLGGTTDAPAMPSATPPTTPTSTNADGTNDAPATPSSGPTSTRRGGSATGAPPTSSPEPGASPGALVDSLVVAQVDPALAPYRRDAFGSGWDYDPDSGCNIRELVLIEEAVTAPQVDDRCRSTDGRWESVYDGIAVDDVADLQIDHFVPLAEAWRSGAATWTEERREAFSNDLEHPETLVAVTGFTNQSKSDRAPDQWLPPDRTAWCTYATDWVSVKTTWSLSVTPAEKATLVQVLGAC